MDEELNLSYDKLVPQIKLDNSGPVDKKVISMYVGFGVVMSGVAFFFGSLIENRLVKRVNDGLLDDWIQSRTEKTGDEV